MEVDVTQTDRGRASDADPDMASLEELLAGISDVRQFRSAAWSSLAATSEFWRAPMASEHLTARVKELVHVGMHASITAFNVDAVDRHVKRALRAGATAAEVIDVLITVVALANHALLLRAHPGGRTDDGGYS